MKQPANSPQPHLAAPKISGSRPDVPVYNSQNLFADGSVIYIDHQGERYRLQLTRQGKLILTK
jgi:hemin uptake protein HemP